MAKRQHKSGVFDPDYRRKGWNKSGFAPKNSTMSISQFALAVGVLVFFAQYLFPETRQYLMTWGGLWPRALAALALAIAVGLLLRRIMWIRVRKNIQPPEPEIKFDVPSKEVTTFPKTKTGKDFEHEVAWVLNSNTKYKAVVTGGAGDGGVDIKIYDDDTLIGIAQCKQYDMARPLPPDHVRSLYGAKQQFRVRNAFLVTTTTFTKESEQLAKTFGITLIDGHEFSRQQVKARKMNLERDERKVV